MNNNNNRLMLPVILRLMDGRELTVDMIVNLGGAIDRTMNNESSFVLIGDADGSERLLAKSAILEVVDAKTIKPKTDALAAPAADGQVQAPALVPEFSDPYQVLGLDSTASIDDVRSSFASLAQAYNPDRVAAAGLPQDVYEFCQTRYQQISDAFAKLTEGQTPTLAAPAQAPSAAPVA